MSANQQPPTARTPSSSEKGKTIFGSRSARRSCTRTATGINLVLQALPIDGKIVLRLPKTGETEERPQERGDQNNKSGQKRR